MLPRRPAPRTRPHQVDGGGGGTRPRSPTTMSQPSLSQLDPFEGTRVLTAGLGKATTAEVAQIVADLGGQHLRTCLASKPPHVLIANDVKSEKYVREGAERIKMSHDKGKVIA